MPPWTAVDEYQWVAHSHPPRVFLRVQNLPEAFIATTHYAWGRAS
jgi:hypothetical protein